MAVKRQVIETRISDLSGVESTDVTTVKFSWDGKAYKLDLTAGELAEFDGLMTRYVQAAVDARATNGGTADGDDAKLIRAWGRDHGYEVEERGKLSASLKAAYYAAQSEPGNGQDTVDTDGKPAKGKAASKS